MANGKHKGGQFEREVCKMLSLWWTEGKRDDVFWRSQSSGGRATIRRKGGRSLLGQFGDIAATDPIGVPLVSVFAIEAKRGYGTASCADAFDASPHMASQLWQSFVDQAASSAEGGGVRAWMLIQKRDKRSIVVFMPSFVVNDLRALGALTSRPRPFIKMELMVNEKKESIMGMHWEAFAAGVKREHIKKLAALYP